MTTDPSTDPLAPGPVFDPTADLPEGTTVLEASAGTGKTHAIAATTARLVALCAQPTGKRPMLQVCKSFHCQLVHTLSNRLTTLTNLKSTDMGHTLQVPKAHLLHLQRTKSQHKGSLF